jgi:ubiquitin C-terminal hydrolase
MNNKSNKSENIPKKQQQIIDAVLELYDEYNQKFRKNVSMCSYEKVQKLYELLNFQFKIQHDAQEFLNELLDKIYSVPLKTIMINDMENDNLTYNNFIDEGQESINRIYKNFGIIQHSELKCGNKQTNNNPLAYKSILHNLVNMVQIEPKYENIATYLNNARNTYEQLLENEQYRDCKMNNLNTYKRTYYIPHDKMSNYLIFQIKTFNYDNFGRSFKISQEDIKIRPEDKLLIESLNNTFIEYEKVGTIFHIGSNISNGHYITDIKNTSKW